MPKQILIYYFSLLSIFGCVLKINAQQAGYFSNINYITSNDGLSQSEVTSILQDKKGFIWIGTRGGLNRFDGKTLKVFQNEVGNSNSLVNNSIETLFEDSKGYLWIGTKSNGVIRYIPELDRFEQQSVFLEGNNPLSDKRVITIAEGGNDEIWLGTWSSGLYVINLKNKTTKRLLNNIRITDVVKVSNNEMWVATVNGVYAFSFEGKQLRHFFLDGRALGATSVVEDRIDGKLYFGTWGEGLYSYSLSSGHIEHYRIGKLGNNAISLNNAYYLFIDHSRNLWIGTWGGSVSRLDLDTKKITNFNLSPKKDRKSMELYKDVLAIYQDKLGILWFGTNGGGVCKVDENITQFGLLREDQLNTNLPSEPIWSLLKDSFGILWVGIKGDNNVYYSNEGKVYNKLEFPNFLPENQQNRKDGVKAMYQDRDGNLWFANNYGAFEIKKTDTGFNVKEIDIINQETLVTNPSLKITSIYQTLDGVFWLGTQQNGLKKSIAPGNPKTQTFTSLLKKERISTFLEDSQGQFWVGTYRGLQFYRPDTNDFVRYSKIQGNRNTLSSDIIICLHEDKQGNLWIGTPNGLNKAVKNSDGSIIFKSFQEKDGLPNNYIHSILEDENGNLWMSTNKGISKYNIKENYFYNYDVNDGLQSNSFMEGAGIKDIDGNFYFGGIYGLNIFHPDSINNDIVPPVVLTGFKISGQDIRPGVKFNNKFILKKAIEYDQEITLSPNENIFSIDFTALDFRSSSRYSYMFKMEGLNEDWQTATSQKNVTYSNLNPGDYEFKVKVVNDRGDNSKAASLKIKILPPLWKTWQAFVFYTLAFIGLLYLYRYIITEQNKLKNKLEISRLNRKKEEELAEMKTRFFTDIAHEFRTPLSLISGPLEYMLSGNLSKEQQQGYLSTIHYHTKRLLGLVSQLLDFRKSETGKMVLQVAKGNFIKFAKEIFISFRELAKSKNISFEFEVENPELLLTYDRNKMEIVLCNLLSNAFKYTPENKKIVLSVKIVEDSIGQSNLKFPLGYCEISVTDNGNGMSRDEVERIFDRFYQISQSKSMNLVGTGIGLALVKNIVELHHGNVFAESEIGKGSAFTVQLPLGESHLTRDQFIEDFKKSEDPVHYQVKRVLNNIEKSEDLIPITSRALPSLLIVEDNPEIRSFVKSIFISDYTILEAENGEIGFKKAVENIPNVIISDLMMPKIDGLELCNKLKETDETQHIPIILLTARTAIVFQEEGYSSGADMYVTKPFNPTVLKAQVENLLNSRNKLREYFGKKIILEPTTDDTPSLDQEFLNKAMKIVEDNLSNENLNRDFLAKHMATSSSTLYRKIKVLAGMDTTVFIRSIRLKKAAQMILNKEDNISGIAYQVGFNDLKYFRKCFKDQFGVTPSKFTKKA